MKNILLACLLLACVSCSAHNPGDAEMPTRLTSGEEVAGTGRLWDVTITNDENPPTPIGVQPYWGWPVEGRDGMPIWVAGNLKVLGGGAPLLPEDGYRISWLRAKAGPWDTTGEVYAVISDYASGRWKFQRVPADTDGSIRIDIHPDWQPHSPSGHIWFGVIVWGADSYAVLCDGVDYGVEEL